jgi:flagellar biogenesis protein FliO
MKTLILALAGMFLAMGATIAFYVAVGWAVVHLLSKFWL